MLTGEYQPSFFIYFDINPEAIDVNIHPTKTEIKFADEQTIFQILMASVREALGKFSLAPTIDFENPDPLDFPQPSSKPVSQPQVTVDPTYNPFHTRGAIYPDRAPRNWENLYEGLPDIQSHPAQPSDPGILSLADAETCPLWQYGGKYILAPTANGLVLINQHRAHIAVLYAQFIEQLKHTQGAMQQLLFPEVLALPKDEMVLVNTMLGDLRAIGFDIEQLSPDSYSIQGVPAQIANMSAVPILQDIILQVRDRDADTQAEWREQIAMSLANNAAIPYGKNLTEEEMRDILTRLVQTANYRRLPNGKTIVSLLSDEEIDKRF